MVSQVGLNTNYPMPLYNTTQTAANNPLNLGLAGTPISSGYEDDIMMSNIDFKALAANPQAISQAAVETPTSQNLQNQPLALNTSAQQNFTGTSVQTPQTAAQMQDEGELAGYLQQRDKNVAYTESGNRYRTTNAGKIVGGILGFLAPLTGKIIDWAKGGKFTELFKVKQLAIVCPALALAGLGIGALADGFLNSKKAAAADAQASAQQTQQVAQQEVPQSINTLA